MYVWIYMCARSQLARLRSSCVFVCLVSVPYRHASKLAGVPDTHAFFAFQSVFSWHRMCSLPWHRMYSLTIECSPLTACVVLLCDTPAVQVHLICLGAITVECVRSPFIEIILFS